MLLTLTFNVSRMYENSNLLSLMIYNIIEIKPNIILQPSSIFNLNFEFFKVYNRVNEQI